jgi:hypothetical protein
MIYLILLLAALAAAQAVWSDVVIAVTYNVSTVPYTVFNQPGVVYYLPDFRSYIDPNKGFAVAEMTPTSYWNFMAVPSLLYLRGLINLWRSLTPYEVTVGIHMHGHLVGGTNFTVNGFRAEPYSICGGRYHYTFAYWVRRPGNYSIWSRGGTLRFIEEGTCAIYGVVEDVSWYGFPNYTRPWALVTVFYMPTARRGHDGAWYPFARVNTWLNGTAHLYRFRYDFITIGDGWYIANYTRVPTVVARNVADGYYGPIHHSALDTRPLSALSAISFLTIGADPGDGVVELRLPNTHGNYFMGKVEVGYVANDTAGYFRIRPEWLGRQGEWGGSLLRFYLTRYDVVEVTIVDDVYTWNTRTMACPRYVGLASPNLPPTRLIRLDRGREFELCNNGTAAYVVGLYVYDHYAFVDVVKPGACVRMRWDGAWSERQTSLRFFNTPRDFCMQNIAFSVPGGAAYTYGYRYFLMPDRTLVRGPPITVDALIEDLWRQLIQLMAAQHNETVNTIKQWSQQQTDLSKWLEEYYKSLPKYQGTIRMDSSTSVWLQTVLNEIRRFTVPGMPPAGGGFTPSPLPGASALTASAAAAAVATAWAASRRSLATAAFLAGFAILASSLFVYHLYGMSVTAGLVLAAVVLMSIGAAAAWFRKSED